MKLILKIALRDLINAKRFSFLFILNLALGILGFVLIHSFKGSVNDTLAARSKVLLGSDISLTGRRALNEQEYEKIQKFFSSKLTRKSETVELYSMGKAQNEAAKSRLVLIKMIDTHYPLYGELKIKELGNVTPVLFKRIDENPKTWISPELAYQMKIKVGESLRLGEQDFVVDGIIEDDSSSTWRGIGLAPKLYISKKYKEATKLISFGSVASYGYLFKLKEQYHDKEQSKLLKKEVLDIISDPAIRVMLPDNSSEQVGRVLNYLSDYLGLVALVAIFLSGIGSSYLFQNFVFAKMAEIGILKSLGLSLNKIKLVFLLQLLILGFCGIVVAIISAVVLLPAASYFLDELIKIDVSLSVSLEAMVVSLFVGILTIFVLCYPILKKLVHKKTVEMFQAQSSFNWSWKFGDYLSYLPFLLSVELLAVWQSHSLRVGTIFTLGVLSLVLLISFILPPFLSFINKRFVLQTYKLASPFSLPFGLGLRELLRSRLSTVLTFLSLSIGVMLLSLIGQLEVSLNKELLGDKVQKPSLFLFDIQMEQMRPLVDFSNENNIPLEAPTPMVRSRLLKLNGKKYERKKTEDKVRTREEEQRQRFRNRGINLTYALKTNASQKIVEGEEFSGVYSGEGLAEISLETRYAKRLGVEIGDTMTFEILGVEVQGKVTSLRKVKWNSFLPNFFITLQPGVLEDAPQTYLATVKSIDFDNQLRVQDLIVDKFPNVSILNVTELVTKILGLFKTMSVAIKLMAYLCIIVGFFVIYAIIQNQIRKRTYDIALVKSFGGSSSFLVKQFLAEYLLMSIFATIIGSFFSILFGNVISKMFFDGVWSIDWNYLVAIISLMCFVTAAIVFLSTYRIYKRPVKSLLD
jgi:putative ABC transport system permease protein